MKKTIIVAIISGLIGFVFGNLFWYLASPLWIDQVVSESEASIADSTLVASGSFSDADCSHKGSGVATLYRSASGSQVLRLTEFEVTNGPDLEVWMVKGDSIQSSKDVKESEWVSLGLLKGNIGDQNYDVPTDVDWTEYTNVVIWCEQFGVLFSPAPLAAP